MVCKYGELLTLAEGVTVVQPVLPCHVFHSIRISIQVDILVRAEVSPSFCYLQWVLVIPKQ